MCRHGFNALRVKLVASVWLPIWLGATSFGQVCDTWEEPGPLWPSRRSGVGMAYDVARGRCVMFGDNFGVDRRTWQWDGQSWVAAPPSGPAVFALAMAYDSARSVAVIFGGNTGQLYSSETWEWAGSDWTLVSDSGPPARNSSAM